MRSRSGVRSPGFPANICSAAHGFVSQARCVRVFRPCPNHGLALERFLGFPVSTVLPSFMYRRGRIPGSRVGLVSRETQKFPRVLGPGKEAATVRSWLPWDGSRRTIGYVDVLSSIDRRILLQRLFVETVGSFLLCRSLVSCWCTIHHCLVGSRKDPWSPSIYFDPRATCVPFGFRCLRASPGRSSIPCLSLLDRLGFSLVSWAMSSEWHEPRGSVLSNPSWDGKVQNDYTIHRFHRPIHGCLPTYRMGGSFHPLLLVSSFFGLVLRRLPSRPGDSMRTR